MIPLILLIVYVCVLSIEYRLKYLNLSYLRKHGAEVPAEFAAAVDPSLLEKISAYTVENSRTGIVESIIENVLLAVFLFGGLLGLYDRWISTLTGSFILDGVLFSLFLVILNTLIGIPFSLYHHFKIENRYGFNTMTVRLWITDLIKSVAISLALGGIVVTAALFLVAANPVWWWFWVWIFLLLFGIFMMYLSPSVLEPLFFKFEPVTAEGLEESIRNLMEKAGIKVSRVFQVDASRRSRHSNAYFTGIGRVKRIVLFDTLIQQMSQEEILAVLAHEVGHWKKKHVLKRIIVAELSAFFGLFIAYHLVQWDGLPRLVGLEQGSFYA